MFHVLHSNLWTHYVKYYCLETFFKSSWYLKDVKWNNLRKKIHKIYYNHSNDKSSEFILVLCGSFSGQQCYFFQEI